MTLTPIGTVRSKRDAAVDEGWGNVVSRVELDEQWRGALRGLNDFSHVIIVFWMHDAPLPTSVERRPRGRADMPEVGILAQRSRHRPNPIGVTAVELVEVGDMHLDVRGLDAIDGTPVLDIKPYVPEFDTRPGTTPDWMSRLMAGYFEP